MFHFLSDINRSLYPVTEGIEVRWLPPYCRKLHFH